MFTKGKTAIEGTPSLAGIVVDLTVKDLAVDLPLKNVEDSPLSMKKNFPLSGQ